MTVLGYLEMPEDDVPPEEIWHHHSRLEEWFDAVKQRREGGSDMERIQDVPMTHNEETERVLAQAGVER